jgi:hypothetical protein
VPASAGSKSIILEAVASSIGTAPGADACATAGFKREDW